MMYIDPEFGAIENFVTTYPADTPVLMLNLLRFRDQAEYVDQKAQACSGPEAYGRYGSGVFPLIEGCGGSIVWQGSQSAMLIGPDDKDWHLAVLARYPSAQAFVDMASSDAYQAVVFHRTAALEDSRLIAMREL
jgi:uncharacterized protein (DUF1330 family)